MPFAIASSADLGLATGALAILTAIFSMDILRLNPCTTSFRRTIDAVLGCIFLVFPIPFNLEFSIK